MAAIRVELVDSMGSALTVVNAARVSFGGRASSLGDRDRRLIRYLADHGHMSPFEHCAMSVLVACPLHVRSQIMRHRTFSYNEISRRYTDKGVEVYLPRAARSQSSSNRQASGDDLGGDANEEALAVFEEAHARALEAYERLLGMGVSREMARGVLPVNTMTEFYMTGNLRNWAHFVGLRDHPDAQAEAREVARAVRALLLDRFGEAAECLLSREAGEAGNAATHGPVTRR